MSLSGRKATDRAPEIGGTVGVLLQARDHPLGGWGSEAGRFFTRPCPAPQSQGDAGDVVPIGAGEA